MDNIFICAICGTECKGLHGLAIHLKHHNIDAETYYNTYIDTSDHTCPYCSSNRKFKNFSYITTCVVENVIKKPWKLLVYLNMV